MQVGSFWACCLSPLPPTQIESFPSGIYSAAGADFYMVLEPLLLFIIHISIESAPCCSIRNRHGLLRGAGAPRLPRGAPPQAAGQGGNWVLVLFARLRTHLLKPLLSCWLVCARASYGSGSCRVAAAATARRRSPPHPHPGCLTLLNPPLFSCFTAGGRAAPRDQRGRH